MAPNFLENICAPGVHLSKLETRVKLVICSNSLLLLLCTCIQMWLTYIPVKVDLRNNNNNNNNILLTAIELSLGGSSPELVQTKQIKINIHRRNNTKSTVQTIQNTLYTSKHITKTHITKPKHTHTHTLQNKLKQTVQDIPK